MRAILVCLAMVAGCKKHDQETPTGPDVAEDPAVPERSHPKFRPDAEPAPGSAAAAAEVDAPPRSGDPTADFLANAARTDLPKIKALIEAGNVDDATDACRFTRADSHGLTGTAEYDKLAAEYDEWCGFQLHVLIIKHAVELVETQRRARPKGDLSDCFSGEYITAQTVLKNLNRLDDPAVKALQTRFAVACPPR